jgi:hypothetical protein
MLGLTITSAPAHHPLRMCLGVPELPFQFDDYYVDGVTAQVLRQMASGRRIERLACAETALFRLPSGNVNLPKPSCFGQDFLAGLLLQCQQQLLIFQWSQACHIGLIEDKITVIVGRNCSKTRAVVRGSTVPLFVSWCAIVV